MQLIGLSMKLLPTVLISALLLSIFVVVAFLPSTFFLDEDGWQVYREVERISFPGGDIVVHEIRQTPSDKGYISLSIEANITSEENLATYVESRTNALNALLETATTTSTIEAIITFKDPINPEDFASLCETSVEKLGEYAIILTDETTNTKSTEVLWFPRPQEAGFIQNITSIKEGYRLKGIIAFECYIKAEAARSLQSDPKVLLIDPLEDHRCLMSKRTMSQRALMFN